MSEFYIELELTPPDEFLKALHRVLPSRLEDNVLEILFPLGKGSVQFLKLQEGLYVNQIDVCLEKSLLINRVAKNSNDYFILNFHQSRSHFVQKIDGQEHKLGFDNVSILLSSSSTEAEVFIPAEVPVKIFNIGFSKEWLRENILETNETSPLGMFMSNEPLYLFEFMNSEFKRLLDLIDLDSQGKLKVSTAVFQILDHFFTKIIERESVDVPYQGINKNDIEEIMKVRQMIDDSVEFLLPIEDLSKQAGMSLSKFKRLFKQVFGTSPYQYFLKNRMSRAYDLLKLKEHTVTEIGYLIGYSNISQFSKAFKNQYGVLPSDIE